MRRAAQGRPQSARASRETRREAQGRPQSARTARSLYVDEDPFAHRRLLHPRDFHKGILDVASAERIIRRGMPPKPECARPPPLFRTEVRSGEAFSVSAPVRAYRHIGDWDMVRCTAPDRTWPSKGAVSKLYDEARQGRPPWKPSSSVSREFSPKVSLEVGMHGKAPEPSCKRSGMQGNAAEKESLRPQTTPPSQPPVPAGDPATRMQSAPEQQKRPLSARSSQGPSVAPKKQTASSARMQSAPASGWAG